MTLAVDPSDPPVEELYGVPLLSRSRENFERALDLGGSDHHGLTFCTGCWSEMGEDVVEVIRELGDRIVYVHFRDVVGATTEFYETFVDDPESNFDETEAMRAGFDGVMEPDHVPMMAGESEWSFGSVLGRTDTVCLRGVLNTPRHGRARAASHEARRDVRQRLGLDVGPGDEVRAREHRSRVPARVGRRCDRLTGRHDPDRRGAPSRSVESSTPPGTVPTSVAPPSAPRGRSSTPRSSPAFSVRSAHREA